MEFSSQEYWSGLPCPPLGDLPNPGIEPRSPPLQVDSLLSEPPVLLAHSGSWASHCGQGNGMHWLAKGNLSTSCLEGRRVGRECQLLLKLTSYLKEAEHKNEILSVRSQDCKCVLYLLKGATICTDKENINEIVNGQYGIQNNTIHW